MLKCQNCGKINDEQGKHCEHCGTLLDITCPDCGAKVYGNSICPGCLKKLNNTFQKASKVSAAKKDAGFSPPQTITCPKCGNVNSRENTYCERCRSKLDKNTARLYRPGTAVRKNPELQVTVIACPECGRANDEQNTHCEHCRTQLYQKCPACGAKVYDSTICPGCLKNLSSDFKELSDTPALIADEKVTAAASAAQQTVACPKCGAVNEPENIYCERCRSRLDNVTVLQYKRGFAVYKDLKFRMPTFVLAVVSASIGVLCFLYAISHTVSQIKNELAFRRFMSLFIDHPYAYKLSYVLQDFGSNIVAFILSLVACILGYIGASKAMDRNPSAKYPLYAAGVLFSLCILHSFLFAVPGAIMLSAAILASFRIKKIQFKLTS